MDGLIIDRAREPLADFEQRQSESSARGSYLWYHVLRPCVLVAFWLFVIGYVWIHFFDISGGFVSNDVLLYLYFGIICTIFLVMLVLAPGRGIYQKRSMGGPPQVATTAELALYATQHESTLLAWQGAHTANVHHDDDGLVKRVDVLADHSNPHQAQLARLLGLSQASEQATEGSSKQDGPPEPEPPKRGPGESG
jgi:hypothetical protein